MLNLDNVVSNKKKSSSENDDWPFRMLIIGPSGSGKTNTLLHLIDKFYPIDKIYLCAKDTDEEKYQYLINKREQAGIKNLIDPHAFIEYSSDMNDVLEDINNYNKKGIKMRSEKFKAIVKELFIRCRKLNISLVFVTQSYFRTPKDARLNSTHYILMKMGNKKELKSIAEENSGHLDFKEFLKIYNHCTRDPYSFMMVDTRPTARVTFKKNFDESIKNFINNTRKEQNKILDAKIESNVNQYKVDRLNAEISDFSSGDLNKYELLKRIDLNYKPNALDKARFEFSPLGKTFSTGLDKNVQGYQEEGVIKLLKDIRDSLARPPRPNNNRDDNDNDNDDNDNDNDDNDDDDDDDNNRPNDERYDNRVFLNDLNTNLNNIQNDSEHYARLIAYQNVTTGKLKKELTDKNNLNQDIIGQARKSIDDSNKERLEYYNKYKNI